MHEIFVILSTFFKAYGHVKKQNEEKRKQASKVELAQKYPTELHHCLWIDHTVMWFGVG